VVGVAVVMMDWIQRANDDRTSCVAQLRRVAFSSDVSHIITHVLRNYGLQSLEIVMQISAAASFSQSSDIGHGLLELLEPFPYSLIGLPRRSRL